MTNLLLEMNPVFLVLAILVLAFAVVMTLLKSAKDPTPGIDKRFDWFPKTAPKAQKPAIKVAAPKAKRLKLSK
jgi:hypothetical protein